MTSGLRPPKGTGRHFFLVKHCHGSNGGVPWRAGGSARGLERARRQAREGGAHSLRSSFLEGLVGAVQFPPPTSPSIVRLPQSPLPPASCGNSSSRG